MAPTINTAQTLTTWDVACWSPITRERASPVNVAAVSAKAAVLKKTPPMPSTNRLSPIVRALDRNQHSVPNTP